VGIEQLILLWLAAVVAVLLVQALAAALVVY
jgi:hypothetical protein